MQRTDDVGLLARAGGGDEAALAALYDRYAQRVLAVGLRRLDDRSLAEEVVQETFVRLWRAAAGFDEQRGSVRAFVYTLAHRTAVDLHRRRPTPASELPDQLGGPGDGIEDLVRDLDVHHALQGLSEHHRVVLELTYLEDLPQQAVAERLGVPTGTVKSRIYHALRALRTRMTEEEDAR